MFSKMNQEPWQIAAARYAVVHSKAGITREDLEEYLAKKYNNEVHKNLIQGFFEEEIQAPPGRRSSRLGTRENGDRYSPPLTVSQMILEYDELQEARKNAFRATILSLASILIAMLTLIKTHLSV